MASSYVRAITSFTCATLPTTAIHEGDVFLATAAVVVANPSMFENIDTAAARGTIRTWRMHDSGD